MFIVMTGLSVYSQTYWKDTVTYIGFPKTNTVEQLHDTIYNNTSSPLTVTWNVASDNLLPGWTGVSICDNLACLPYNTMSNTSIIPPNDKMTLDVQVKAAPTAMDGCSYVTLNTSVGMLVYKYCTFPTSTKEFDNNSLVSIYPNPATNFINLNLNNKKISSINVVNVIGKRIAKFSVDPTNTPEIRIPLDRVSDGVYLLQFADNAGKVLGVRRVTKQ